MMAAETVLTDACRRAAIRPGATRISRTKRKIEPTGLAPSQPIRFLLLLRTMSWPWQIARLMKCDSPAGGGWETMAEPERNILTPLARSVFARVVHCPRNVSALGNGKRRRRSARKATLLA